MKKRKKINWAMFRFSIKCVFLFFAFLSVISSCEAQISEGTQAKNINLPNVNNESIALSSLKGKVVLLDFWASWCRPCRQTVPGLKKLYSQYHDKGFEIYGVSLDENKTAWKTAIEQDQSTWIHVNDNSGDIANQWNITYIPTTFLLDKKGKILAINAEPKDLSKIIEKLIN